LDSESDAPAQPFAWSESGSVSGWIGLSSTVSENIVRGVADSVAHSQRCEGDDGAVMAECCDRRRMVEEDPSVGDRNAGHQSVRRYQTVDKEIGDLTYRCWIKAVLLRCGWHTAEKNAKSKDSRTKAIR
jgi:hypothetical protein